MVFAPLYTTARYIRTFSRNVRSWAVIANSLMAACGGGDLILPSNGGPTALRVVDGDGQSGSVGQLLGSPVIVEVTDAQGEPVKGGNC